MFNFFIDKYVKSRDFECKQNRDKLIRLTGIIGLFINILLFIMKFVIGLITHSISVVSDSWNNLSDCLTSIITIYGSILSGKPADKDHPYGHGRTEYVATLMVGLFVTVVGLQLLKSSLENIFNPEDIIFKPVTIVILIVSILLKIYMYSYNKKTENMSKSTLNRGVAIDALNDVIATSIVLFSIIFFEFTNINIDGYVGVVISILVIKSGVEIFFDMGTVLLGKKISDKTMDKVIEIILKGKYIVGVHNIQLHEYGRRKVYGSCHVEVPANIDVYSMHKIINEVEMDLYNQMGIIINIHIDPTYILDKPCFYCVEDPKELEDIDMDDINL